MGARELDGEVTPIGFVRRLPPCELQELSRQESENVLTSVWHYDVAVAKSWTKGLGLPTVFYGFEVRQTDCSRGGQKHSIFAFEEEIMCDRWFAAIRSAVQDFSRLYGRRSASALDVIVA